MLEEHSTNQLKLFILIIEKQYIIDHSCVIIAWLLIVLILWFIIDVDLKNLLIQQLINIFILLLFVEVRFISTVELIIALEVLFIEK